MKGLFERPLGIWKNTVYSMMWTADANHTITEVTCRVTNMCPKKIARTEQKSNCMALVVANYILNFYFSCFDH